MIASSPVPRAKQPKWHESSGLQGFRENDSTPRQWLRARTNGFNSDAHARQIAILTQQMGRLRRRIPGGSGSGSGGVDYAGEWNPAKSYPAKTIVFFTPDGMSAGAYISERNVAAGISPDTGKPNWTAFPAPAPGQFQ